MNGPSKEDLDKAHKMMQTAKERYEEFQQRSSGQPQYTDFAEMLDYINNGHKEKEPTTKIVDKCVVQVSNDSKFALPKMDSDMSVGVGLRANIEEEVSLKMLESELIPTGIFVHLPPGVEGNMFTTGELIHQTLITNPVISPEKKVEIKINLVNITKKKITIKPGDVIANLKFSNYKNVAWLEIPNFNNGSQENTPK